MIELFSVATRVATSLPLGEKATTVTPRVQTPRVLGAWPDAAPRSLTVLTSDAEATKLPSDGKSHSKDPILMTFEDLHTSVPPVGYGRTNAYPSWDVSGVLLSHNASLGQKNIANTYT
jgi:hypothetical protein